MIKIYRNFSTLCLPWYLFMSTDTYRNFSTFPYVIPSCRSIHTATFPLHPMLYLHVDQYIPQLFHSILCCNFMVIITYRNFSTPAFVLTSWLSLHTATFPLHPMLKLYDDHYIPQLFHFLPCFNFMIIVTYRNFFTFSYFITSWWSLHTATFPPHPML